MDLYLGEVVVDCRDPRTLAEFWREVTGYDVHTESDGWVALRAEDGGPALAFQQVPEPKNGKNRLHLDLYTDDVEAEVERVIGLGAEHLWDSGDPDDVFVTLADPEGNEFCVCLDDA